MSKIIHSITIEDFRSFDSKTIELEGITCLVGANESGKTNLLDAIYLAKVGDKSKKEDRQVLRPEDIRKNSSRYADSQLPTIKFELSTKLIHNSEVKKLLSQHKTINLVRNGNSMDVELPELTLNSKLLINTKSEPLMLTIEQPPKTDEEKNENQTTEQANVVSENEDVEIAPESHMFLKPRFEKKYQDSITKAVESGTAQVLEGEAALPEIKKVVLSEIQANLKLFFWSYDKKYSLPDMIPIEEVKTKLEELPVIKALFKLGGYQANQVPSLLEGRTETDYENLFSKLSKTISKQVKSRWRTNEKLEIKVVHKTDHLLINIKEPGYSIEPKYRSEGLRWFLAFIIGMIAQTEELENYIILIDEPALHLHPGGQKDVLEEINRLAQDNQIAYSTHSHFMIDKRYKERVRFLIKETKRGYSLTDVKKPTKQDIFKDPLLRSALVYSVSDISFLNERNILVEGSFDKKIINLLSTWLVEKKSEGPTIDPNDTSVIACDGAGEITKHAKLYKGSGLICLSLYDSDKRGKEAKNSNSEQTNQEKLEIKDIYQQAETTEDLIPIKPFKQAIEDWEMGGSALKTKIRVPRMNSVISALDKYLNKKGLFGEEFSNERLRLKHDLEDKIVLKLKTYLQDKSPEDADFQHLVSLNDMLVKKIDSLKS